MDFSNSDIIMDSYNNIHGNIPSNKELFINKNR